MSERAVTIPSGDIVLEGRLREGRGPLGVLMLHPHPQYGGDMHSPIVTAVCEAAASLGATTLRVNFRGAGGSQGGFDGGAGEQDDARAALAFLRESAPAARLVLAGYSFGAMIASKVAADADIVAMLLVSPAGDAAGGSVPSLPTLILTGSDDAYVDAAALRTRESERCRVVVADGVDHFWWGSGDVIARETSAFLEPLIAAG